MSYHFTPETRNPLARLVLLALLLLVAPAHAAPAPAAPAPAGPAHAARHVALTIGNDAYSHVAPLRNPTNDARDVAAALRSLGFEVIEGTDLDFSGMRRALGDFAAALEGADVGLFYYAGHAMQVGGVNYIAPIDAQVERAADAHLQLITLGDVLRVLEASVPVRLVFLDSCRNNPFSRSLGRTRGGGGGQGLATVDAAVGTLIAYSTAPNAVAEDGDGRNSPFTKALLEHIGARGLEVRQVLSRVRQDVIETTDGRQVPWDSSSLTGDFRFRIEIEGSVAAAAPAAVGASAQDAERALALTPGDLRAVRRALAALGHIERVPAVPASADALDTTARRGIARFQEENGLGATGFVDERTYSALIVAADPLLRAEEDLLSGKTFEAIDMRALLAADRPEIERLTVALVALSTHLGIAPDMEVALVNLADGVVDDAVDLAWSFALGEDVPEMPAVAARLFALASTMGDAEATNEAAWMLSDAIGTPPDHELAVKLFQIAAEEGIADAFQGLGEHYENGTGGLPQDMAKAAEAYKEGAERGYSWSKLSYAELLEEGLGVPADRDTALELYRSILAEELAPWEDAEVKEYAQEGADRLGG